MALGQDACVLVLGAEELRGRAVPWSALIWRALKRVLLGAVGQGHCLESMGLTYIPQKENLSSGYVWRRGQAMRYDVPVGGWEVLTLRRPTDRPCFL